MSGPWASPGSGQPVSARCAAGRSSGPFCGLVLSPGSPRTSARCLREPAVSGDLPVGPLGPGRGSGRRCVSQVQTLSLCQGVGLERPGRGVHIRVVLTQRCLAMGRGSRAPERVSAVCQPGSAAGGGPCIFQAICIFIQFAYLFFFFFAVSTLYLCYQEVKHTHAQRKGRRTRLR